MPHLSAHAYNVKEVTSKFALSHATDQSNQGTWKFAPFLMCSGNAAVLRATDGDPPLSVSEADDGTAGIVPVPNFVCPVDMLGRRPTLHQFSGYGLAGSASTPSVEL